MRITREKHLSHLVRLMPLLILAIVAQYYLYTRWTSSGMALDVSLFMAIGVALIAGGFALYDQFHMVTLYRNHLEIRLDLLGIHEEILYRDIQDMDIHVTSNAYYNVTLYLWDDTTYRLLYLDDVQDLKAMVRGVAAA